VSSSHSVKPQYLKVVPRCSTRLAAERLAAERLAATSFHGVQGTGKKRRPMAGDTLGLAQLLALYDSLSADGLGELARNIEDWAEGVGEQGQQVLAILRGGDPLDVYGRRSRLAREIQEVAAKSSAPSVVAAHLAMRCLQEAKGPGSADGPSCAMWVVSEAVKKALNKRVGDRRSDEGKTAMLRSLRGRGECELRLPIDVPVVPRVPRHDRLRRAARSLVSALQRDVDSIQRLLARHLEKLEVLRHGCSECSDVTLGRLREFLARYPEKADDDHLDISEEQGPTPMPSSGGGACPRCGGRTSIKNISRRSSDEMDSYYTICDSCNYAEPHRRFG
jgi:DNA-directed RNA polymerase subunit M/transcription elongation factor TFIIS